MAELQEEKKKLVSVYIRNACPEDAYAVGRHYEVTPEEAKRLASKDITGNPPKAKKKVGEVSIVEGSQKKS